jgi:hypothetical protein
MRLTFAMKNRAAVELALGRRSEAVKRRLRSVVQARGFDCFTLAAGLCAFRTGYMLSQMKLDFTPKGFGWTVGWRARDFIGTIDQQGRPRSFYPPFVVLGTSRQRPQDNLTPAFAAVAPALSRDVRTAVRDAIRSGA